ncbi:glycosyltransferase family 4 protein [Azoarcus olearius]|uniref:Glycosyltransferase n=1 Tax=Azoarcus sp. (strain BH72) TaxID=418699 RepID=A1K7Y4_AZOSB|nr:glycosyltransferase family 4 protein [Azoarcus olearius]CAL94939.1 glycosyltransferase [Azoarcus olearius]
MKILHIESGRFLYGGGMQVLYLMEGLARRGVDNLFACPRGAHIAPPARAHARVVEMPMHGDPDFGMVWRLRRLIQHEKPDLVHVHSRRGADLWGGLAAALSGTPCVLSRRVDNPESRAVAAVKYPLYDRVITISEGIREVLRDAGVPRARLACVRSAIAPRPWLRDYDKAGFRAALGLAPNTPVIGMVAQLIERKGHRYLLAALHEVLPRHPGLQVLIFGRGPLEDALRVQIAEQGLAGNVRLMGFADNLPEVLGCLDVVVHPADMEGLGVSLLQASTAAVPILASRVGGIPEAVRDGETGLLVPPGDVGSLAGALNRLLDDPLLRARMGDNGRALMLREFSVDAMCEGNLAIYRDVLSAALPDALADPLM